MREARQRRNRQCPQVPLVVRPSPCLELNRTAPSPLKAESSLLGGGYWIGDSGVGICLDGLSNQQQRRSLCIPLSPGENNRRERDGPQQSRAGRLLPQLRIEGVWGPSLVVCYVSRFELYKPTFPCLHLSVHTNVKEKKKEQTKTKKES